MDVQLAPEIIEQIIDHMHNDKQSLLAMCQTCQRMLLRSRFHLFSSLEVTSIADPSGWSQGRKATDPRSLSSLLDILDAPYSSMGNAIRHLTINFGFHFPQTLPKDLSRVRKNLTGIRTLYWRDDTWIDVPVAFKSLIFDLTLEQFNVSGIWFQKSSEIAQMISMWPSTLKSVEMGSIACSENETADSGALDSALARIRQRRIHFQTLHSRSAWAARYIFNSLIEADLIQIDRLILGLHYPSEAEARWVKEFLSRYGPDLREVVLLVPPPTIAGFPVLREFWKKCNFQDFAKIRVLHVQSLHLGGSTGSITDEIRSMIRSIPHPNLLEEIRIRFMIDLSKLKLTATNTTADTTIHTNMDSDDQAPLMEQFLRFDWKDFAECLLSTTSSNVAGTSSGRLLSFGDPTSRKRPNSLSSLPSPRGRNFHIELVASPPEEKVFVDNYSQYVKYVYDNGLYLLEERESGSEDAMSMKEEGLTTIGGARARAGGESALVFSQPTHWN